MREDVAERAEALAQQELERVVDAQPVQQDEGQQCVRRVLFLEGFAGPEGGGRARDDLATEGEEGLPLLLR